MGKPPKSPGLRNEGAVRARWHKQVQVLGILGAIGLSYGNQSLARSIAIDINESNGEEFPSHQIVVKGSRHTRWLTIANTAIDVTIYIGRVRLLSTRKEERIIRDFVTHNSILASLGCMDESLEDDSPLAAVCSFRLATQLASNGVPVEIVCRLKVDVLRQSAGIVTVVTIPVGGFVSTTADVERSELTGL